LEIRERAKMPSETASKDIKQQYGLPKKMPGKSTSRIRG